MDLISKYKLGTSNTKLIAWPNSTDMVGLRILSQSQLQEATFATEKWFKENKIDINMSTADEFDSEKATQVLYRALVDPVDFKTPVCNKIDIFRQSLTRDERSCLIDEYLTFEKDCSPRPENMKDEEFEAWIDSVKKTPEELLGNVISSRTLKACIITMAKEFQNLPLPRSLFTPNSKTLSIGNVKTPIQSL
jgi:hypothetical protein